MIETSSEQPFAIKSLTKLSEESNNSESHEVEIGDEHYIIKDIFNPSFSSENFPGETLEEKAASMSEFFAVLMDYLGVHAWDTHFPIGKNLDGEKTIKVFQKKVNGRRLDELKQEIKENGQGQVLEEVRRQINSKLEQAFADPRLKEKNFSNAITWVRGDALFEKNVFITEGGDVVLVDLL